MHGLTYSELQYVVTCPLFHLEKEERLTKVLSKPKLTEYWETEEYVQKVTVKSHRSLLAQLRGGTAPLQLETGRYISFSVEDRNCGSCNTGQVEAAFLCGTSSSVRGFFLHLLILLASFILCTLILLLSRCCQNATVASLCS